MTHFLRIFICRQTFSSNVAVFARIIENANNCVDESNAFFDRHKGIKNSDNFHNASIRSLL